MKNDKKGHINVCSLDYTQFRLQGFSLYFHDSFVLNFENLFQDSIFFVGLDVNPSVLSDVLACVPRCYVLCSMTIHMTEGNDVDILLRRCEHLYTGGTLFYHD